MTPAIRAAQAALAAAEARASDLEARADALYPAPPADASDEAFDAWSDASDEWLLWNGHSDACVALHDAENALLLACADHHSIREELLSLCRRLGAEGGGRQ